MRIVFLIIVLFHGLIHLLGFAKGLGLREIKELTLPISKPMAFVWLTSAVLLLFFDALQLLNSKYAWLAGFVAVAISQTLIILFWKDAKFGTLPNILILLASMISYGHYDFHKLARQETIQLLYQNKIVASKVTTENSVEHLPEPVRNWICNSGMIGQSFISIGKVTQKVEMKMKPEQKNWMTATATQYTIILP